MKKLFEIDSNEIIKVSAKQGIGIEELINALIERIPALDFYTISVSNSIQK